MRIIYCADPLNPRQPDAAYAEEVAAADSLSLDWHLVSFEALVNDSDPQRAVRAVPEQRAAGDAIYRGWMLKPDAYRALYEALLERGVPLINDPAEYAHCHHLPESYGVIEGHTPHSIWLPYTSSTSLDDIMASLQVFGDAPIIVKDYVKSQKHYWKEACFIPQASDQTAVAQVVQRFLDLQDDDLNEGLVFREFIEFEPLAEHSRSGIPLTLEYRAFFLDGTPILWAEYWEEGDYALSAPPVEQFIPVAERVQSRFFTWTSLAVVMANG